MPITSIAAFVPEGMEWSERDETYVWPTPNATLAFHINLDERGEFFADVRNAEDETVFEIHGFDIFEDGFMRDKEDMAGLLEYLVQLGIAERGATLVNSR